MSDTFQSGDLVKWVSGSAVYIYLCDCTSDSIRAYVITQSGQIDWFYIFDLRHVGER